VEEGTRFGSKSGSLTGFFALAGFEACFFSRVCGRRYLWSPRRILSQATNRQKHGRSRLRPPSCRGFRAIASAPNGNLKFSARVTPGTKKRPNGRNRHLTIILYRITKFRFPWLIPSLGSVFPGTKDGSVFPTNRVGRTRKTTSWAL